jgi:hypothetical protein
VSAVALKHCEKYPMHAYEVRPRKDHRGVDLISDALRFGTPNGSASSMAKR